MVALDILFGTGCATGKPLRDERLNELRKGYAIMNKIDETALVSDDSIVGENVCVYKNARILNSTLAGNNSVGDFSTLRDTLMDRYSSVQRYCDLLRCSVGKYTVIEKNAVLHDISIGSFCEISWHCSMGGDNHNYKLPTVHHWYWNRQFGFEDAAHTAGGTNFYAKLSAESCSIGNDVWVGSGVTVNRKVRVGDGAILASGCVVTKDVPPYAIVAGVPARIIKYRFDEPIRRRLLEVAWWNWPEEVLKANRHLFEKEVDEEVLLNMEKIASNFSK